MKLKSLCKLYVLFALLNFSLFAQEEAKDYGHKPNQFAAQFGIANNFTLMSFQGSTFSGKYHFTQKSAIRLGVSIFSDFQDKTFSLKKNESEDEDVYISDQKEKLLIGLDLQYLHYSKMKKNLFVYYGGGVFLGKNKSEYYKINESDSIDFKNESYIDGLSVGLGILFGVEYFIAKDFSLSAEYGIDFRYSKTEGSNNSYPDIRKFTNSNFSIRSKNVLFGLTVYL